MTPLVLASTSRYRKELVQRLGLKLDRDFVALAPSFDEDQAKISNLKAHDLCLFLGQEKARSLATSDNCVVGSDQMLVLREQILGKPGTEAAAIEQLMSLQGQEHELLTSLTVYYQLQKVQILDVTKMTMQTLQRSQVESYVHMDQPLDCAGSYKIEKNGISLFERIQTEDFTAIQGLPLLALSKILRQFGYLIPSKEIL